MARVMQRVAGKSLDENGNILLAVRERMDKLLGGRTSGRNRNIHIARRRIVRKSQIRQDVKTR